MANKIQIKRGIKSNLPILSAGEPGFCTDTGELIVGDGSTNYEFKPMDQSVKTTDDVAFKKLIAQSPTTKALGSDTVSVFDVTDSLDAQLFSVYQNGDVDIAGVINVKGDGTSTFAGNVTVGGNLTVEEDATVTGLMSGDNLTLAGNLIVNGNTTLGDATTDSITFTAKAASLLDMNSNKITNLANGTAAGDAVNFSQLDNIVAANDAMIFKGTVGAGGTHTITAFNTLATYNTGWTYKVIEAGTIKGSVCEVGDTLISMETRTGSSNVDADWMVVQANIDGAVVGPATAVDSRIAVFNGTSGKLIKDGGVLISNLATSTHVHGNITTDGKIGSTAGLMIKTGTGGALTALAAGSSGQYLQYDGTWTTPPDTATAVNNILEAANSGTQITYAPYTTSQASALRFYTHATNPTGTSRLNIGAHFYATQLYDDGIRVHNFNSTIDGGAFI